MLVLTKPNQQALYILDGIVITESPDSDTTEVWIDGVLHKVTEKPTEIIRLARQVSK